MKTIVYVIGLVAVVFCAIKAYIFLTSSPWICGITTLALLIFVKKEVDSNNEIYAKPVTANEQSAPAYGYIDKFGVFVNRKPILFLLLLVSTTLFMLSILSDNDAGNSIEKKPSVSESVSSPISQSTQARAEPTHSSSYSSSSSNSSNESEQCSASIQELTQILLSINNKIMAMPPLSTIYVSTSEIWRNAKAARDAGNFAECNRLTGVAIRTSRSYAN